MRKISENIVFNDYTLNLFTDASIKKIQDETIGCSGVIATIGDQFVDKELALIRDTTNGDSEIKAIELGVNMALLYKDKVKHINLFSDSKTSICGLREWIFNWVTSSTGNILEKSDGQPVKNQSVYINIINTIIDNDLRINFYHQVGHVNLSKPDSLERAKDLFIKYNYIQCDVDIDLIKKISHINILVDNDTRYVVNNSSIARIKPELAMREMYKPFDIYKYARLINAPLIELGE